jgi:hypothetical protein
MPIPTANQWMPADGSVEIFTGSEGVAAKQPGADTGLSVISPMAGGVVDGGGGGDGASGGERCALLAASETASWCAGNMDRRPL